jgi:hypothetical protein
MPHIAGRRRCLKILINERLHGSRVLYFIRVMPDGALKHCVSNFGLFRHLQRFPFLPWGAASASLADAADAHLSPKTRHTKIVTTDLNVAWSPPNDRPGPDLKAKSPRAEASPSERRTPPRHADLERPSCALSGLRRQRTRLVHNGCALASVRRPPTRVASYLGRTKRGLETRAAP